MKYEYNCFDCGWGNNSFAYYVEHRKTNCESSYRKERKIHFVINSPNDRSMYFCGGVTYGKKKTLKLSEDLSEVTCVRCKAKAKNLKQVLEFLQQNEGLDRFNYRQLRKMMNKCDVGLQFYSNAMLHEWLETMHETELIRIQNDQIYVGMEVTI